MNFFPSCGTLVFLLSACCTPSQGGTPIDVLDVAFENGERHTAHTYPGSVTSTLQLMRESDGNYRIEETVIGNRAPPPSDVARFGIKGIDTMLENIVVARTNDNSYFQMETRTAQDAQLFFRMTTRPKLGEEHYSYEISAVYQYDKGRILSDVQLSISGFTYSTAQNPQQRCIIHSGAVRRPKPHLLWTEDEFYYSTSGNQAMLLTLKKPTGSPYEYYFVVFRNESDLNSWVQNTGQKYSIRMPLPSREIVRYFHENAGVARSSDSS